MGRQDDPISTEIRRTARARHHAETLGFKISSDASTASFLTVLAASVPRTGRILELGTGVGVGTAALVAGVAERRDVELVTIELDEHRFAVAQSNEWPPLVKFFLGDLIELLPTLGQFDLIFADALQADDIAGGNWVGLERTIEALKPRALLLMDDMAPQSWWTAEHAANKLSVRTFLGDHSDLIVCDIMWSSGLLLCANRRNT